MIFAYSQMEFVGSEEVNSRVTMEKNKAVTQFLSSR